MALELKTEITIHSDPAKVWAILTDFAKYPDWNPFIPSLQGEAKKGSKLKVRILPPGAKGMVFTPKVLSAEPHKELRWLGHLLFPGLFDGEHAFELVAQADGTTLFKHSERFKGILVGLFKKQLLNNTLKGFEAMNQKLKERAERK